MNVQKILFIFISLTTKTKAVDTKKKGLNDILYNLFLSLRIVLSLISNSVYPDGMLYATIINIINIQNFP